MRRLLLLSILTVGLPTASRSMARLQTSRLPHGEPVFHKEYRPHDGEVQTGAADVFLDSEPGVEMRNAGVPFAPATEI
jgi:hypothetical protein